MPAATIPGRGLIVSAALIMGASQPVWAQQSFPAKPLRILTGTAGGSSDIAARLIAQGLTTTLGQQVIVDSRPNVLARETVMKSPPDGYNLLLGANSFYLGPLLRDDAQYDPLRDFAPVSLAITGSNLVVVHPSLPVKSIKDLIALARAKPGMINYASGASGASTHLGPELFKSMAQVNIMRIPYKGGAQALADVVSGQVHLMFASPSPVMPYMKAGRLRALAITSAQRSPWLPDIPTVAAAGLPDFVHTTNTAIYAPARTPPAVIGRLSDEIALLLRRPDLKGKFADMGLETVGSTPDQLASIMKSEMTRMGKVIKEAGIREE